MMHLVRQKNLELIELIPTVWDPSHSASMLAKALADKAGVPVSRNTVIGLYDRNPNLKTTHPLGGKRLREDGTQKGSGYRRKPKPARAQQANDGSLKRGPFIPKARKIVKLEEHIAFDASTYGVPLMELGPGDCRWPVNDPAPGEQHLFCGFDTLGHHYCPEHRRRSTV